MCHQSLQYQGFFETRSVRCHICPPTSRTSRRRCPPLPPPPPRPRPWHTTPSISTFLTPPTPRQSRHQPRSPTTTTHRQPSRSPRRSLPELPSKATPPALGASSISGRQAPPQIFWDLSTAMTSTK